MVALEQYTENDFRTNSPTRIAGGRDGLAEILISGSLVEHYTDGSNPESGSWPYLQSSSSSMAWNTVSLGNISDGYVIGVKLSDLDITQANNKHSFQLCNSLAFTVSAGSSSQTFMFDIKDREISNGYAYFKVHAPLNQITDVKFLFQKNGDDFQGYDCSAERNGEAITFIVEPYFSIEENSVFNPLIGNVTGSVASTLAYRVESVVGTYYLWGYGRVFDGEYAPTGSIDETVNGGSGNWTGSDPVEIVDGGEFTPYGHYILGLPAEIPDYYYTAIANIGGRFLGSKAGYEVKASRVGDEFVKDYRTLKEFISRYVENSTVSQSRTLTKETLELVAKHTSSVGYDTGSLESYDYEKYWSLLGSGSLDTFVVIGSFTSGSTFSGSIDGEDFSGSLSGLVSGHFSGSFTGSFAGWVDGNGQATGSSGSELIDTRTIVRHTSELGVDPAFFTAQEFSGSVYSIDADNIPDISDMQFESVKFATRTVYESFSNTSDRNYVRTYNRNNNPVGKHAATLPIVGDTIYSEDLSKRLSNSKIFIQETGQVFLTDEFASVVSMSAISGSE